MPGLGDALGKAMEDSQRDLSALVRRAAESESESPDGDPTKVTMPLPPEDEAGPESSGQPDEPPERPQSLSDEERDSLIVSLDEAMGDAGGEDVPPPPPPSGPEPESEPEAHKTEPLPDPAVLREALSGDRPAAPAQEPEPETQAEDAQAPSPEAGSPPAAAGAAGDEPIAPFAPSGVIRRQLRPPSGRRKAAALAAGEAPLVRRPLFEELAGCRRVASLPGADTCRRPALVRGISEAVRAIADGKAGKPAFIAFCGASPNSGTSTIAAAAALELAARFQLRVLLVDADLCASGLGGLGGTLKGPGLTEVLADAATLPEAAICSESESLAILPLGGTPTRSGATSGAAALLGGAAFGRMLDACRTFFDVVIFDVGDVSRSRGALALAGTAGAAILVVQAGRIGARGVRSARRSLVRSGTRLVGAILNCASGTAEK